MQEFPRARLVMGLGNPDRSYEHTYHNVGRAFVQFLAGHSAHAPSWKNDSSHLFRYAKTHGRILILQRTAMNESGKALRAALARFRIPSGELMVLHDDSDIAFGKIKVSYGRGSAGHRGVESIFSALRTKRFWRCRIGIRSTKGKAGTFVLTPIRAADQNVLASTFSNIAVKLKLNENVPCGVR